MVEDVVADDDERALEALWGELRAWLDGPAHDMERRERIAALMWHLELYPNAPDRRVRADLRRDGVEIRVRPRVRPLDEEELRG